MVIHLEVITCMRIYINLRMNYTGYIFLHRLIENTKKIQDETFEKNYIH